MKLDALFSRTPPSATPVALLKIANKSLRAELSTTRNTNKSFWTRFSRANKTQHNSFYIGRSLLRRVKLDPCKPGTFRMNLELLLLRQGFRNNATLNALNTSNISALKRLSKQTTHRLQELSNAPRQEDNKELIAKLEECYKSNARMIEGYAAAMAIDSALEGHDNPAFITEPDWQPYSPQLPRHPIQIQQKHTGKRQ